MMHGLFFLDYSMANDGAKDVKNIRVVPIHKQKFVTIDSELDVINALFCKMFQTLKLPKHHSVCVYACPRLSLGHDYYDKFQEVGISGIVYKGVLC